MSVYATTDVSSYDGNPEELYKFVKGSDIYRYTSADHDVTIDLGDGDETFVAQYPMTRNEFEQSKELLAQNLTITAPRDLDVATLFATFVPFETVSVTLYRRHMQDTDYIVYWKGKHVQVEWNDNDAKLTCEPRTARVKRNGLTRLHAPSCQHPLYGPRCGVDRANWTISGTVTAISADGLTITALNFASEADEWAERGTMILASGDRRKVVDHTGTSMTLLHRFGASALQVGHVVTVEAGCKQRFQEDCIDKFGDDGGNRPDGDTGKHYGGYPHAPLDNLYETGIE